MKNYMKGFILALVLLVLLGATSDLRDSPKKTVARFESVITLPADATDEVTGTLSNVSFILGRIDIVIPTDANDPDVTVTITGDDSVEFLDSGALDDGQTVSYFIPGDINEMYINEGTLTIGATPDAEPAASTAVTVKLFGR